MVASGAGVVVDDDVDEVTVAIVGEPTGATIDVVAEASVVVGPTTTLLEDDGSVDDTGVLALTNEAGASACKNTSVASAAKVVFLVLSTA
jgi:hypothetical protein